MENQVTSRELSQELKKAGYEQEGIWWWVNHWRGTTYMWDLFLKDEDDKVNEHVVAPTVAELGERLPYNIHITKGSIWRIYFNNHYEKAVKLADALAKMWLYLKIERIKYEKRKK